MFDKDDGPFLVYMLFLAIVLGMLFILEYHKDEIRAQVEYENRDCNSEAH